MDIRHSWMVKLDFINTASLVTDFVRSQMGSQIFEGLYMKSFKEDNQIENVTEGLLSIYLQHCQAA